MKKLKEIELEVNLFEEIFRGYSNQMVNVSHLRLIEKKVPVTALLSVFKWLLNPQYFLFVAAVVLICCCCGVDFFV